MLRNKTDVWAELVAQTSSLNAQSIYEHLNRPQTDFCLSTQHLTLNYSHQLLSPEILRLLLSLAEACQLQKHIESLFQGDPVNVTEKRPALHTALRAPSDTAIYVDGQNIMPDIVSIKDKMKRISSKIRASQWLGFSGLPITDIVHIGVGGSSLGPQFSMTALAELAATHLNYHILSEIDPLAFEQTVRGLTPSRTLFIVASKSFTTEETLLNTRKAMQWIGQGNIAKHFIAITNAHNRAQALGIHTVLPIWPWVGGRYSFCSAVNLLTAISIGFDAFEQMLDGAHQMDQHFLTTPFNENIPVMLALLGIWNNNFLNTRTLLILTYAKSLVHFASFIQQLDMESNGKSLSRSGKKLSYSTSPIVWGGSGIDARHSYYQLLSQGTHQITADLISIDTFNEQLCNYSCLSKVNSLTKPQPNSSIIDQKIDRMALNLITLRSLTPHSIGQLVTLYEHKVYTQGVIWDVNSFDQPGVESAKEALAALSS